MVDKPSKKKNGSGIIKFRDIEGKIVEIDLSKMITKAPKRTEHNKGGRINKKKGGRTR
jgi:hypothetical protein